MNVLNLSQLSSKMHASLCYYFLITAQTEKVMRINWTTVGGGGKIAVQLGVNI